MKRLFVLLLELFVGIPYEALRYLQNKHRIPLSKKLEEAIAGKESEITVYFKAGGYRWSVRGRLINTLQKMGVTRIKSLRDQNDAVLAVLSPPQIKAMSKKRWVLGMATASEMLFLEKSCLEDPTNYHFDDDELKQALEELDKKYQL